MDLRLPRRTASTVALAAVFLGAFVGSAPAGAATIVWGSSLTAAPSHALNAPVDTVYWATRNAHLKVRAPRRGQVTIVTVRGSALTGACLRIHCSPRSEHTILFQDLRRVRGGKLRVVATSQPFELPASDALYSFEPTNFFVEKGDSVGMATLGGAFKVFASVPGSSLARFTGAGSDRNGARIRGSSISRTELLLRVSERV
jgi:hypothetical protein